MGTDILTTIIAVEREIEERLGAERRQAGEMLALLRSDLAAEALREEERLEASAQQAIGAARAEAEERAAGIVRRAADRGKELAALDDAHLAGIIMRHLVRVLPEEGR